MQTTLLPLTKDQTKSKVTLYPGPWALQVTGLASLGRPTCNWSQPLHIANLHTANQPAHLTHLVTYLPFCNVNNLATASFSLSFLFAKACQQQTCSSIVLFLRVDLAFLSSSHLLLLVRLEGTCWVCPRRVHCTPFTDHRRHGKEHQLLTPLSIRTRWGDAFVSPPTTFVSGQVVTRKLKFLVVLVPGDSGASFLTQLTITSALGISELW